MTGRAYKRLEFGPVPAEMPTLHREMQAQGLVRLEPLVLDGGLVEKRTIVLVEPDQALSNKQFRKLRSFVDDEGLSCF